MLGQVRPNGPCNVGSIMAQRVVMLGNMRSNENSDEAQLDCDIGSLEALSSLNLGC